MFADRILGVTKASRTTASNRSPRTGSAPSAQAVGDSLAILKSENALLTEALDRVAAMFKAEDQGWAKFAAGDDGGLERDDVAKWSKEIREAIVGNPWMKAGIRLRNSYIFQDGGIHYEGIPASTDGRRKEGNIQELVDNPINQAVFFSKAAHKERETANYSDGNVYYLGNVLTKELEAVPFAQIEAEYHNPEAPGQVWAYRRRWTPLGATEPKVEWYYTDTFWSKGEDASGARLKHVEKEGGEKEPVNTGKVIFDGRVNTQLGWGLGVPDAVSALVWSRVYTEFMKNGKIMSDALAQFAFQASMKSGKGQTAAGLQLAQPKRPGATVVTGGADQLVPMSSAGKGYDFGSGTALLAAVATSIGVSVIHLASDPGTAGGSYGSASTLDLPTLLATEDRREWHAEFDTRVLRWMGAPEARASFTPLADPTNTLRILQSLLAAWNAGLYEADEMREMTDRALGRQKGKAPEGIMLPNNERFVNTVTNDGQDMSGQDGEPKSKSKDGGDDTKTKTPGTGKGKATGTGNSPKSNDLRTDQIAQALQNDEIRDMLRELLERVGRD